MNFLRVAWQLWKKIGLAIGNFIARIVLSIFYFTILLPFGLAVRLLMDPLGIKHQTGEHWLERETNDAELEDARRLA